MGGVALLARSLGHRVSGQDMNVYPPMSTQLQEQGITLNEGYEPEAIPADVDVVIIGNALSRGNPAVEFVLNRRLSYCSGAQWLSENLLNDRWVIAVAGTHGKTTTSSMVAWILEDAGMNPGFLIGGIPVNFGLSSRLGESPFFVVEADEYDTAFFDKRSKFVHYRPQTAILNNLEYDHADIFPDLAAIQRQFHHFIRTVPGRGQIILPQGDRALAEVIEMGCWTPQLYLHSLEGWHAKRLDEAGRSYELYLRSEYIGTVNWTLTGDHNISNGMAAVAAAHHAGINPEQCVKALSAFAGVKRRMEVRGVIDGITVYDDFAHHPTAIKTTISGLRRDVGQNRIFVVIEPRSNTMRMGVHHNQLVLAFTDADSCYIYEPEGLNWDIEELSNGIGATLFHSVEAIIDTLVTEVATGDHILIMSNGGFDAIHQKLINRLQQRKNDVR